MPFIQMTESSIIYHLLSLRSDVNEKDVLFYLTVYWIGRRMCNLYWRCLLHKVDAKVI